MTDLISLTHDSRLYNFHSHTQFCDGRATMEQFARAAVDAGFAHYGFSPHSPIPFESPCNMSEENVGNFLAEVRRIRDSYADAPTRFYAAMEIDYLGPHWGPAIGYFRELPLDYRIASVHFIPTQTGEMVDIDGCFKNFAVKMDKYFRGDIRYVVETFYSQSTKMIEEGGFDILGHFDKIGHNAGHFRQGIEQEGWYIDLVEHLIDLIIARDVTIELNTKAWTDHHRMFPGRQWLGRLARAGVKVVVNSDAHYPELINASRPEGFAMLEEAGFIMP